MTEKKGVNSKSSSSGVKSALGFTDNFTSINLTSSMTGLIADLEKGKFKITSDPRSSLNIQKMGGMNFGNKKKSDPGPIQPPPA
jgi:hypothetical protein